MSDAAACERGRWGERARGRRRPRLVDVAVALVFAVELATGTVLALAFAILVTLGSANAVEAAMRPAIAQRAPAVKALPAVRSPRTR